MKLTCVGRSGLGQNGSGEWSPWVILSRIGFRLQRPIICPMGLVWGCMKLPG